MKVRLLFAALLVKIALGCCSLAPADFHGTRGLASEVRVKGKLVHVLGYQNTAQNKASGANAMFLPIPAKAGTMSAKNMLDVSNCPRVLEDIEEAAARSIVLRTLSAHPPGSVEVFDRGLYTVVLAQDARDIPAALERVRPERRPQLAPAIFAAYEKWYPGWTFALCCFNAREATRGEPMLWWYEPLDPDRLFFPALDAHSGEPPDLQAEVEVDHAMAVATESMRVSADVRYRDKVSPEVAAYLPGRVLGMHLQHHTRNGDFVFLKSDVRAGNFRPERVLPPGATP